ncbi:hypothetical protein DDIC_07275 [Desulfovibrio desulfuricans]|uniref:Uncharacterized protein n=1 Tax=Desulfovibrio desulfuricans TaxID=876 RepID=A0A4P7ULC2_DESDE|nr:hypothetical protein [Desulfovibrio desulfuricans]QCC85678.1 hypothetical protein DDIC_07275 [Desulfovibrio desulfuricans]
MPQPPFSPLRCKLPRKPWIKHAALQFWHCESCARLLHEYLSEDNTAASLAASSRAPECCGRPLRLLRPQSPQDAANALDLDYEIVGGLNNNAVRVRWNNAATPPLWIALQTYTGVYLKHVSAAKLPPVVFPLSDEDAYAYCDKDVCEQCLYCCKKGCAIYVYTGGSSIYVLNMDKISQYFLQKLPK